MRRDIEVIDVAEITNGVITGRTRTWNLLYAAKGLREKPPFGDVRRLEIERLWNWEGESWGGPVPESTDKNTG